METENSHDVTSTRAEKVEVCDVCAVVARALVLWLLIALVSLRQIVAFVFGAGVRFGERLLNQLPSLRILIPLTSSSSGAPDAANALRIGRVVAHRLMDMLSWLLTNGFSKSIQVLLCLRLQIPVIIHNTCQHTLGRCRFLTSLSLCALLLKCITLARRFVQTCCELRDQWIILRQLITCPLRPICWAGNNLFCLYVGKIRSNYPSALETVNRLLKQLCWIVLRLARAANTGIAFLIGRSLTGLCVVCRLLSRADAWLIDSLSSFTESCFLPSEHGPRFLKDKSRCYVLSLLWRVFHLRSPRFSFIAILVVVSVLLSTFLYLSHVSSAGKLTRLTQYKDDPVPNKDNLRDNLLPKDEDGPQPGKKNNNRQRNHWKEKASLRNENNKEEGQSTLSWKQVSHVISLMKTYDWQNHTLTPVVHMEELMAKISYLRQEMVSEKNCLPKLTDPPLCKGDLKGNEVEDLLCIEKPKYLSHIKNPCWYSNGGMDEKKLRCLPYFHILGCAKSGTTDLWNRLLSHPHLIANDGMLHKEALWWSWRRYGYNGYSRGELWSFNRYVDLFQDTARIIEKSIENENLHHQIIITGDASPPDFWDFRGWSSISQNRDSNIPRVITPHLMKHFYDKPKFIIMFRDPIDRLYSDYFFVGGGLTSLDFHNDVLVAIDLLHDCVQTFGLVHCFYDHELYVKLPLRLPFACYSVFMREWLQVFPLESFLLIKTEDYKINPENTLKSVIEFLGLGPLKEKVLQEIAEEEKSRITEQRIIAGPMKNETRIILHELLDSCSHELAKLVKNDNFLWH
ncbi:uncharacterized protein LOC106071469 [Biomphalaria glabrata]|uniref:Uncharacterized protein LOC106071469 n=1 Tax=Biomphalaria glabrata TaxID=6526 RepID=A0A9W2ZBU7_BIOGL|nr:uncharacterized protein LOC106071469 [Biomphalaria glabrata]KAI8737021.1 carbohydrate sulfotransferase 15 [Biomphalaria glabrata]